MNQSQNASQQTGQAVGQAQEKGSNMMDKANNAAQDATTSVQEGQGGQQMKADAQEVADAAKITVGAHK
ncbi:pollen coat-like protein [Medicago truncatula]|uniref:Pollen coat-like protein n=2 Tax=Medicago truncatula TaxID=3880 RepID=A0A072TWL7_MEDTR|nr:pollen coat-like protein [Medicago truncatula]